MVFLLSPPIPSGVRLCEGRLRAHGAALRAEGSVRLRGGRGIRGEPCWEATAERERGAAGVLHPAALPASPPCRPAPRLGRGRSHRMWSGAERDGPSSKQRGKGRGGGVPRLVCPFLLPGGPVDVRLPLSARVKRLRLLSYA